jgi:hypothetical protein
MSRDDAFKPVARRAGSKVYVLDRTRHSGSRGALAERIAQTPTPPPPCCLIWPPRCPHWVKFDRAYIAAHLLWERWYPGRTTHSMTADD